MKTLMWTLKAKVKGRGLEEEGMDQWRHVLSDATSPSVYKVAGISSLEYGFEKILFKMLVFNLFNFNI